MIIYQSYKKYKIGKESLLMKKLLLDIFLKNPKPKPKILKNDLKNVFMFYYINNLCLSIIIHIVVKYKRYRYNQNYKIEE